MSLGSVDDEVVRCLRTLIDKRDSYWREFLNILHKNFEIHPFPTRLDDEITHDTPAAETYRSLNLLLATDDDMMRSIRALLFQIYDLG